MPAGDRAWLDQHTRAMLAGLRDANPLLALGRDTLESLAAEDPEDVKAMLRSWLETYDQVLSSFEHVDAPERALEQHEELLHTLDVAKDRTEALLETLDSE